LITIWHNPRCSKSRQTLALLEGADVTVTIRKYLQEPPSEAELSAALGALGETSPHAILRKGEPIYKELGLGSDTSDADLISAMVAHPILIERPLVFSGDRAVIGRPPEAVKALL
jgi:arsenate reductase